MSYIDFTLGLVVGSFGFSVASSYPRRHKESNRNVPADARHRRTLDQQALALAFATLYTRYADGTYPHFVLSDDRELVTTEVGEFLRENRDKLGEMTLGPGFFQPGENALTKNAVDRAIDLFLQI